MTAKLREHREQTLEPESLSSKVENDQEIDYDINVKDVDGKADLSEMAMRLEPQSLSRTSK